MKKTITFEVEFNSANIVPNTGNKFTVPVFFIAEGQLWRGEYHQNGCFYAYGVCGKVECFASYTGVRRDHTERRSMSVCTQWAYVDQFTFSN